MILLDYSSVVMSSIIPKIDDYENNIDLIRHQIFNLIRYYNVQYRDDYGQMVICCDAGNNWRKDKFPQYKANRKKNRDNSVYDWQKIFADLGKIREEVQEYMPFRSVYLDRCEADDAIGVLAAKYSAVDPVMIVSPDRDFVQLQQYPNVQQFSNIQKKMVEPKLGSAKADLLDKIMRGDVGDGVPNVLSDDDTLITEGKRQTPLSKKKIEMLLEDPEALGTPTARRILRNREVIDLDYTPSDLRKSILDQFNSAPKGNITKLMTLLTKHRMNLMMESLQDFEVHF